MGRTVQLQSGPGRELPVGLVHDDQSRRGATDGGDRRRRLGPAGRVVRRAQERDVGTRLAEQRDRVVAIDLEIVVAGALDDRGAGDTGDVRVQGVGRFEEERATAGAAEGQQEALQDLVGPVGTEDLWRGDPVQCGNRLAELGGAAGRDSGGTRRPRARRAARPATPSGGGSGDSFVLSRTSAST